MPPKRKPDPSGSKDFEDTMSRKRKGKEKAKDVTSNIPADFFENQEYDDFQVPIGVRQPPLALSREQRDIEEATRLSLQTRPAAESGESGSSAVVRPTPRITRSSVAATLEEEDFQEPNSHCSHSTPN